MNTSVALSVQKRINVLDFISLMSVGFAFVSLTSVLVTTLCLCSCLLLQAVVFRSYFKYIKDNFRMAKRIVFIIGNFGAIIALLYHNNLL
jgi:hypothetical protein